MKESFKKQHLKLDEKEKELKEDLFKNTTKVKEELENFLFESEEIIKNNERIDKLIKYYEKSEANPIIKTLSYISEIEGINNKAFIFLYKPMKNMNIHFKEDNNTLEYDNYHFNGITSPTNINIYKDNNYNYTNISWNIEKIFISSEEKDQYKFIIELKNKEKEYTFEGSETNIQISGVEINSEFEFKVKVSLDGLFGEWSKSYKLQLPANNFSFGGNQKNNLTIFGIKNNNNNNLFYFNNQNIPWKKLNKK